LRIRSCRRTWLEFRKACRSILPAEVIDKARHLVVAGVRGWWVFAKATPERDFGR
jgi:hypothetical protein